jgi:hypothetical protein
MEGNDIKTRFAEPRGIVPIAIINLAVYTTLLVVFSICTGRMASYAYLVITYPSIGIICTWGLLRKATWAWYLSLVMWTIEAAFSSVIGFVSFGFYQHAENIIFLSFAIFRIASIAYFATGEIRVAFDAAYVCRKVQQVWASLSVKTKSRILKALFLLACLLFLFSVIFPFLFAQYPVNTGGAGMDMTHFWSFKSSTQRVTPFLSE